jgi:hypothetical protein
MMKLKVALRRMLGVLAKFTLKYLCIRTDLEIDAGQVRAGRGPANRRA